MTFMFFIGMFFGGVNLGFSIQEVHGMQGYTPEYLIALSAFIITKGVLCVSKNSR